MTTELYIIAIRSHFGPIFSFRFYWVAADTQTFRGWITVARSLGHSRRGALGGVGYSCRFVHVLSRSLWRIWNASLMFKWHSRLLAPRNCVFQPLLNGDLRSKNRICWFSYLWAFFIFYFWIVSNKAQGNPSVSDLYCRTRKYVTGSSYLSRRWNEDGPGVSPLWAFLALQL